jgi:fatty-acyl-CoA synthase
VLPRKVEKLLVTHHDIVQVAMFEIPDEYYGEELVAWIRLHAGGVPSVEAVREHCKGHMAHLKIAKHIRFVEEFPMTITGKVRKFRMRVTELFLTASRNRDDVNPTRRVL